METQTVFTLGEAAKASGRSKGTISKAIHSGRLSVRSHEGGAYQIDAAELFRVFPSKPVEKSANERLETPGNTLQIARLEAELSAEREKAAERKATIDDLRGRLDRSEQERQAMTTRLTALLTDQSNRPPVAAPAPAARPGPVRAFLRRLAG